MAAREPGRSRELNYTTVIPMPGPNHTEDAAAAGRDRAEPRRAAEETVYAMLDFSAPSGRSGAVAASSAAATAASVSYPMHSDSDSDSDDDDFININDAVPIQQLYSAVNRPQPPTLPPRGARGPCDGVPFALEPEPEPASPLPQDQVSHPGQANDYKTIKRPSGNPAKAAPVPDLQAPHLISKGAETLGAARTSFPCVYAGAPAIGRRGEKIKPVAALKSAMERITMRGKNRANASRDVDLVVHDHGLATQLAGTTTVLVPFPFGRIHFYSVSTQEDQYVLGIVIEAALAGALICHVHSFKSESDLITALDAIRNHSTVPVPDPPSESPTSPPPQSLSSRISSTANLFKKKLSLGIARKAKKNHVHLADFYGSFYTDEALGPTPDQVNAMLRGLARSKCEPQRVDLIISSSCLRIVLSDGRRNKLAYETMTLTGVCPAAGDRCFFVVFESKPGADRPFTYVLFKSITEPAQPIVTVIGVSMTKRQAKHESH
eukprot:m.86409 g.86409  ORF g.86409 m.86409 type:complete len:492 (-) comp8431_c0_seq1:162-1637(-)